MTYEDKASYDSTPPCSSELTFGEFLPEPTLLPGFSPSNIFAKIASGRLGSSHFVA